MALAQCHLLCERRRASGRCRTPNLSDFSPTASALSLTRYPLWLQSRWHSASAVPLTLRLLFGAFLILPALPVVANYAQLRLTTACHTQLTSLVTIAHFVCRSISAAKYSRMLATHLVHSCEDGLSWLFKAGLFFSLQSSRPLNGLVILFQIFV